MAVENNVRKEDTRPGTLSRNMRIFLLLASLIIITITIVLTLKPKPEITPEFLQQEIQSLQQQLPIKVDANTELKNVELEGMQIRYSFVVVDDPTQAVGVSTKDEEFPQHVENSVKQNVCLNKNTKRYINSNVSLEYFYVDKDNVALADFEIPTGFCK